MDNEFYIGDTVVISGLAYSTFVASERIGLKGFVVNKEVMRIPIPISDGHAYLSVYGLHSAKPYSYFSQVATSRMVLTEKYKHESWVKE